MTEHTPATPLPFTHKVNGRLSAVLAEDGLVVMGSLVVPGLKKDAGNHAYFTHAANAYPKLVEALRELLAEWDVMHADEDQRSGITEETGGIVGARALLRELGEE
jgi:hypothetical protein